jgi:hypothetical protein
MNQFAKCLKDKLAQDGPLAAPAATSPPPQQSSPSIVPGAAPATAAKPISGFTLMIKVIWSSIVGLFRRS